MSCLFNPVACAQGAAVTALLGVPLWVWLLVIVIVLAIAYRLLGWAGLVAAAIGVGYAIARFPKRSQAEFDRQNDNSSDFPWSPPRPTKPDPNDSAWNKWKRGE